MPPRAGTIFDNRPHLQALWGLFPQPQPINAGPIPVASFHSSDTLPGLQWHNFVVLQSLQCHFAATASASNNCSGSKGNCAL